MPLTRIGMPAGKPPDDRTAVVEAGQRALRDALGMLMDELFQVITEHAPRRSDRRPRLSRPSPVR